MKKIIVFQLFLLCLVSCKKQELTTVADGKVLAINSNLPIVDATVLLSLVDLTKLDGFGTSTPSPIMKTTQTDKNGYYQFAIDPPREGFSYRVSVPINPNGTSYDTEANRVYVSKYGVSTHDFHIKPFGWLKIHLKNTSSFDANDEFVFTNLTLGTHQGNQDKIILAKTRGDSTYGQFVSYRVTKNKVQTFKYINFKSSSNDTTQLDIFY
jgi:hypothetical protein